MSETSIQERATWSGLISAYWHLVERIQQRLKNREPVWYPEIEFLAAYVSLLVLARRADASPRHSEQRGRLVDLTMDLDVLAQKARNCREPQP